MHILKFCLLLMVPTALPIDWVCVKEHPEQHHLEFVSTITIVHIVGGYLTNVEEKFDSR
jgi:hypothetical protein